MKTIIFFWPKEYRITLAIDLNYYIGCGHNWDFNVAECNLGKVNLELMLPAVSPSLHMIRGGAPLEFAGANYTCCRVPNFRGFRAFLTCPFYLEYHRS